MAGDAVFLEEELNALGVGLDHLVLVGEKGGEVHLEALHPSPDQALFHLVDALGGFQKGLGGNAPHP